MLQPGKDEEVLDRTAPPAIAEQDLLAGGKSVPDHLPRAQRNQLSDGRHVGHGGLASNGQPPS